MDKDKPRDERSPSAADSSRLSLVAKKRQRFIKQSSSEKTKREKLRRLSFVGAIDSSYEHSEMGPLVSDCKDEFPLTASSTKRFKFTKKFLDKCNTTVPHASVPRKLRSASKKRSPTSSNSKKMNGKLNGVELIKKDAAEESKLDMQQSEMENSESLSRGGTITKDEEEVVETLFALAGMFTNKMECGKIDETELDESLEASPMVLPKTENSTPRLQEMKQSLEEDASDTSSAPNGTSNTNKSSSEDLKVETANEGPRPDLSNNRHRHIELDSFVSPTELPILSLLSEDNFQSKGFSSNPLSRNVLSEASSGSGLLGWKNEVSPLQQTIVVPTSQQVDVVGRDAEVLHAVAESKANGLSPSKPSFDAGMSRTNLQSSSPSLPPWLSNAALPTRTCLSGNAEMTNKDSRVSVDRKSWKRCSAHVYISRLIEVLRVTEGNNKLHSQTTRWLRSNESKQGDFGGSCNVYEGKDELASTGVVLARNVLGLSGKRKSDEVRTVFPLHKRPITELQETPTSSGLNSLQKQQGYDFWSLSSGASEMEAYNGSNSEENGMGHMNRYHVPYPQSFAQNSLVMPYPLLQSHYSSPHSDYLSVAAKQQVHNQLTSYHGNTVFDPSHLCITTSSEQQQHHHEQQHHYEQQQRDWAANLAAHHYKTKDITQTKPQNWQNGGRNNPIFHDPQAHLPSSSHSSMEALGPKYTHILSQKQRQHQFFMSNTPLPSSRVKQYHQHHLPSGYQDSLGKFHVDGTPLKLLCNGHI